MVILVDFNINGWDNEQLDKDKLMKVFTDCLNEYIPDLNKQIGTIKISFINSSEGDYRATASYMAVLDVDTELIEKAINDCLRFSLKQKALPGTPRILSKH